MSERIHEVIPGVLHWTNRHPNTGLESGSHFLADAGVAIDPIAPPEGLEWFEDHGLRAIVLTNRHHTRSAFELQERFGVPVRAPETGMDDLPADKVDPYAFGAEVLPGIVAHAISPTWPDETALELRDHRAIAIADGITNYDGLGFFPDHLLGDDPEAEKQRLRDGFARLADAVDFDTVLFAHGAPVVADGRAQIRAFVAG